MHLPHSPALSTYHPACASVYCLCAFLVLLSFAYRGANILYRSLTAIISFCTIHSFALPSVHARGAIDVEYLFAPCYEFMGAYAWVPYRHPSLHVLTVRSRYPAPAPASPPACFALLRAAADPLMYTLLAPLSSSLSPSPSVAYNTPHLTKMKRTFTDTRPGSL
ncbi:hypothetical protein OH76DRAFT_66264 [Lentinus brumalis]|uniref:Uncharacterized protein n=1 Tax=Lentinus brumalis TaxID=2498619 RepID=A0A371DKK0_9APHY|nr:hypothetical protein OH76DRAFT_66264 [Polyporus brumalis]